MTVTTKDIARICGVSRGTVDRALNGREGINPRTRDLILKTAGELGYKPDFLARSLVTGRTMTIGVVVFDVFSRFFGQLVHSIEAGARESGYFVYLTLTQKDSEAEKSCIKHLAERKVDGIIVFSVNRSAEYEAFLSRLGIPVVTIVNRISDKFDYAGIDDYSAVLEAVRYLESCGHRNIVYVSTLRKDEKTNMHAVENRRKGFIDGCRSGVRGLVIEDMDYCSKVLEKLQSKSLRPSAILCSNDIYALEVMKTLKAEGYRIPEDISLMGFDDIDALKYIEPGLTTVAYPIDELGRKAFDLLEERINGMNETAGKEIILPHRLVPRNSVARVG